MADNRAIQIARVVDVAQGEVSRSSAEHPRGSNITKYGRWYGMNGVAWCAIGISWVLAHAGLDFGVHGPRTAWVPDYRAWGRARGRWSVGKSDVRVGDIMTFRGGKHVELVVRVTGSGRNLRFWCVGFNTSWRGSGGSFADGVFVAENERTHDSVDGTLHPFYGVIDGMVRVAQQVIGAKVDGDLGPVTLAGIKHWQAANGLTADGIPGPETYQRMTGGTPAVPAPAAPAAKPATAKASAPPFPLPRDHRGLFYYGPTSGPRTSVSGRTRNTAVPHDVTRDAHGKYRSKGLYAWQRAAGIPADGRYGPITEAAAKRVQRENGLTVDGKIGPDTWRAVWADR